MAARMVSRSYSSGILKNGNRIAIQKVNVQISNVFKQISSDFRSTSKIFPNQVQIWPRITNIVS